MKFKLLTLAGLSAIIASTSIADADSNFKSGFKFGAGGGYRHHSATTKADAIEGDAGGFDTEAFSAKGQTNAGQLELHGGYDWFFGKFLLALGIDYRYAPGTKSRATFQTTQLVLGADKTSFNTTLQHRHDCGFSLNIGGLISDNFALYAIGNVRYGKFTFLFHDQGKYIGLDSGKASKKVWGAGFGIGARAALTQGYSIALNATCDTYQKIKIKEDMLNDGDEFYARSKSPRVINVIVRLIKKI